MAERTFKLTIIGDADRFKKAIGEVDGSLDKLGRGLQTVGKLVIGFGAATGVAAAAAGTHLFNVSRELQAVETKAQTVFGDQIGMIRAWAEENRSALGTSTERIIGLGAATADLLIPMGFQRDQAAAITRQTLELSGALSEWSAGQYDASQVSEILTKAYLGEREQLKSLGIAISEADVQAKLAQKGQEDLTGAALQQAKALATLDLIMEKSTDAQAAFAEGGPPIVRAQAAVRSALTQVRDTIAVELTPVFTVAAQWLAEKLPIATEWALVKFRQLSGWVQDHRADFVSFFNEVRTVAGTMFGYFKSGLEVVLPLLVGFGRWIVDNKPVLIAAITALGIAVASVLGPAGLIALGVAGVITAIGVFRDNWGLIWATVQDVAIKAADKILAVIEQLAKGFAFVEKPLEFLTGGKLDIPSAEQGVAGLRSRLAIMDPLGDYRAEQSRQHYADVAAAEAAAKRAEADKWAASEAEALGAEHAAAGEASAETSDSLFDLRISADDLAAANAEAEKSSKSASAALKDLKDAAEELTAAEKARADLISRADQYKDALPEAYSRGMVINDLIAAFAGIDPNTGQITGAADLDMLARIVQVSAGGYSSTFTTGTGASISSAEILDAFLNQRVTAEELVTEIRDAIQNGTSISVELSDDLQLAGAP